MEQNIGNLMTPPLLNVGEKGQSNVTMLASSSSASRESTCQNGSVYKERNYMGLSDCSSVDSSTISNTSEANNDGSCLNLKATELRLGLPGSQSPERDSSNKLDEKPLFPFHPVKDVNYSPLSQRAITSGNKRGFSDAMDGFSEVKKLLLLIERELGYSLGVVLLTKETIVYVFYRENFFLLQKLMSCYPQEESLVRKAQGLMLQK